ncbi:urease accessory protein UreE [Acuticoccus sp. I52.16.1]|uniref:urease accessory protein UreE n=1 Tax=Acuticoccus sp. I52.16.1 TaxID=2928472 RepID=UPI001FD41676|nr:urease accessory protein UreE [Acuticoccus sp. I52.16.1]UOM34168.1 urease accessory protein UreE [Acuticoccus sp. I52.16.1]
MSAAPMHPSDAPLTAILGSARDEPLHSRLHALGERVETVELARSDLARRRLRVTTDRGRSVAIALARSERLFDGAVLYLGGTAAIVVRVAAERWLRLAPATAADALALGYHAGNLHWRVAFEGEHLLVAVEGEDEGAEGRYLARLADFLQSGRAVLLAAAKPRPSTTATNGHHHPLGGGHP